MRETVERYALWYLIEGVLLVITVFFMMEDISKVVFALTIPPFPNWGWVLASGLVGILLALIL